MYSLGEVPYAKVCNIKFVESANVSWEKVHTYKYIITEILMAESLQNEHYISVLFQLS